METLNDLQLRDENIYPGEEIIKTVLEDSFNVYRTLLKLFDDNGMVYEWRYYKDGKAWLCKVQKKKRTIVWMSARKGYMLATLYFPVRLLDDILNLDITPTQKEKILNTQNVGKSKPCTFILKDQTILEDFEKVMLFKIKAR